MDVNQHIRILRLRDRIKGLPRAWVRQYGHNMQSKIYAGDTPMSAQQILDEIHKLDLNTATTTDLRNIFPTLPGWVECNCDFCEKPQDAIYRIGRSPHEYDEDIPSLDICYACLQKSFQFAYNTVFK